MNHKIRTRFAPSPTGFMHIGNLRTALYEYLIAKSQGGEFILRIEDTDKQRQVEGAEEVIYSTLKAVGLKYDEGPDIGGNFGPYRQSERKGSYLSHAQRLIGEGKAYYCFCGKTSSEELVSGHHDKCREINSSEAEKLIKDGVPYVIRQKMPVEGSTTFHDTVFGDITVENKELEDQILIKSDGYPTYNFANVIDDNEMKITHVVRGSEYLSSTPKYNLLYEALGWKVPLYIHLPLIMGKSEDGTVSKLSKRHGAVSFEDLVKKGYLPEAIINYIAFLGWCPDGNREIYSLEELADTFSADRISKSPAVFDYKKLGWFNGEYIKLKPDEEFRKLAEPYISPMAHNSEMVDKIADLVKNRVSCLSEIPEMIDFFKELPNYDVNLFENKKSKTSCESSLNVLLKIRCELSNLLNWSYDSIYEMLINAALQLEVKNGAVMWPVRIAVSGKVMTPGGAVEILEILGKEESLKRIDTGIEKLKNI